MIKIAAIADVHIRNLKYHKEYKQVFSVLYQKLAEENPDAICVLGDISHTRVLSAEYFDMAAGFLESLADIAETYVIAGNHDISVRNTSRLDTISPIIEALGHPKLHMLKYSGETHIGKNVVLNVYSLLDKENWNEPSDDTKINVGLYHGAVVGVETDLGWKMQHGIDPSVFHGCDYLMLGDIHKAKQAVCEREIERIVGEEEVAALCEEGWKVIEVGEECQTNKRRYRIRKRMPFGFYCGSLIQQNHGEQLDDKGFLVWEIENKDEFNVRHIHIPNPKPFVTIQLTPKGRIPKGTMIPKDARVRLVSEGNLPIERLRRATDIVKHRFSPESVVYLNRAAGRRADSEEVDGLTEDLREITVQEKLIEDYLKSFDLSEQTLQQIFELNQRYNTQVEFNESFERNVHWKLKSLEWSNLFNYGSGNKIDFSKLGGIVTISGANGAGKSNSLSVLLFALFNSVDKNVRKNVDMINEHQDSARAIVEVEFGGRVYKIDRKVEKYIKKLRGEESVEAKTEVDFSCYEPATNTTINLCGNSRLETDNNIRKIFGTKNDFLLTAFSSQFDSLMFINEGSTKRKEILGKFLDLEFFEQKHRLAKDDASDYRGATKRLEDVDFDANIKEFERIIRECENDIQNKEEECSEYKTQLQSGASELENIRVAKAAAKVDNIDEEVVRKNLQNASEKDAAISEEILSLKKTRDSEQERCEKIQVFLSEIFDVEQYRNKQRKIEEHQRRLKKVLASVSENDIRLTNEKNKTELLQRVPCGSEFPECQFLTDAVAAKERVTELEKILLDLQKEQVEHQTFIDSMEPLRVEKFLSDYEDLVSKKQRLTNTIASFGEQIAQKQRERDRIQTVIQQNQQLLVEYNQNKEEMIRHKRLCRQETETLDTIGFYREKMTVCEKDLLNLHQLQGSNKQKLEQIAAQQEELVELRVKYSALDLYQRAMGSNGVSLDVIRRKLPLINEQIASILTNIVSFEIFLENEDKKLNIMIKHSNHNPRQIETASGAERVVASIAIRLALMNVSTLPRPNIVIFDEPSWLDEDNIVGFTQIMDLIKSHFDIVILISHLESMKDAADEQIEIYKRNGYAHINQ